jgi:Ca-activated chloride channel homolog
MKTTSIVICLLTLPLMLLGREGSATQIPAADVRIELDQEVHPSDAPSRAVVKVRVTAPERPSRERTPVNLSIVLDRSGSMQGDKIEYARLAAIEALRRLRPGDVFSFVTYDSEVETLIPAQRVTDIESAEAKIRAIRPRGMTALYGGVNQGAAELRKNLEGHFIHRILLLSDGIANVGPSSPADLERLGRALAREDIGVTTIGVGLDYNEDLMTRLARASDGNTYFVESSKDLPRILTAELGDVASVFARRAILRIEFDDHIQPISVLGREGEIRGRQVEIPLHHLYAGSERFALIEVELPQRKAGAKSQIGAAEVRYHDLATQQSVTARSPVATVRYSSNEAEIAASANAVVQTQVLEVRAAEARDRAIALSDQGRKQEAAEEIRRVGALYQDAAERLNEPALAARADAVALEADTVDQRGIDNTQRKAYRAENQQTVNQQNVR